MAVQWQKDQKVRVIADFDELSPGIKWVDYPMEVGSIGTIKSISSGGVVKISFNNVDVILSLESMENYFELV